MKPPMKKAMAATPLHGMCLVAKEAVKEFIEVYGKPSGQFYNSFIKEGRLESVSLLKCR